MRFPLVGRIRPVSHMYAPSKRGVCTLQGTPPRLVAELRLTQDRRDMTIRAAERAWV
jgi:hypothetical protein